LLLNGLLETCDTQSEVSVCLIEANGPLYESISYNYPNVKGSEYLGPEFTPGSIPSFRGADIVHEDVNQFSYRDETFDVVCHSDVLEHVFDYTRAVDEMRRVLKKHGKLIF
jgi:hypothetical protein